MAADKQRIAFISYSRRNKEFAAKLAKELRSAGYPIWFDLFDILTGVRWDDEVEKALRESSIFVIVLTPASIASENVKDEIGYAIDNGKRILPILLEQCEVPFRLRRFQYVDFTTKSFEEGFESAKELLSGLINEESTPIPAQNPTVENQTTHKAKYVGYAQAKPASSRKLVVSIVGAALVFVLCVVGGGIGFSIISNLGTPTPVVPSATNPATETPVHDSVVVFDTLTSTSTSIPETPTPDSKPFYIEEFNDDLVNWFSLISGVKSDLIPYVENGKAIFEINTKNTSVYLINQSFDYTDVEVDAVVLNRGVNDILVSLICRYSEIGWYEVRIANTGLFEIYAVDKIGAVHKGSNRIYNGGSQQVKPGVDTNVYKLVCQSPIEPNTGPVITFYVNGRKTQSFTDNEFKLLEGKIGVAVSSLKSPVNVQFESVEISKP